MRRLIVTFGSDLWIDLSNCCLITQHAADMYQTELLLSGLFLEMSQQKCSGPTITTCNKQKNQTQH